MKKTLILGEEYFEGLPPQISLIFADKIKGYSA